MINIYTLINPITNDVFYVGATKYPYQRLNNHISNRNRTNSFKNQQINIILNKGFLPDIKVVDICSPCEVKEKEEYYIRYYLRLGFKLEQLEYSGYSYKNSEEKRKSPYHRFKTKILDGRVICKFQLFSRHGVTVFSPTPVQICVEKFNREEVIEFFMKEFEIIRKTNPTIDEYYLL